MYWDELVAVVSDSVIALAAIATATAAIIGLNSWRRQLRGTADFDTAKSLLKATYKVRDAIQAFRSPFVSGGEFPADYGGALQRHTAEEEVRAWAHVYSGRWRYIYDAVQEYDAVALEAEAMWGNEVTPGIENLRRCIVSLRAATDAFLSNKQSGGEDFQQNPDFGRSINRDLYSRISDDEDPLGSRVSAAIAQIEELVKPHIDRR